jgi:UDP:flavonoid glycosyltransferase YjiC (YdhE family)
LRRAVDDIASLDVDVLVAVGPEGDPALLGAVSDNVHVERFVAQSAILGLVDLVVHHGGTGTVLGALAAGLPQLILPQGADQFFNAEAISALGAGRALRNDQQEPGAIAASVAAMLGSRDERDVAIRLSQEIAAQPTPGDVVGELEQLVAG